MVQDLILARDGPECLGAGALPTPRLRMQETISLAASLAYLAAVGMGNAAQIFDFRSADSPRVQHHFQEQISAVALFTLPAEAPVVSHSCSASRALCRKLTHHEVGMLPPKPAAMPLVHSRCHATCPWSLIASLSASTMSTAPAISHLTPAHAMCTISLYVSSLQLELHGWRRWLKMCGWQLGSGP